VLTSLWNMFRVPDLRNKILFTLLILTLYRLGSYIPVPGIDLSAVEQFQEQLRQQGGTLAFLQLFSGRALVNMALFALGIMPYITASIIVQVLTVVIPKFEQWQQQGAVGQRKLTQTTRYLTVVIALVQATGLAFVLHNGGGGFFGAAQNQLNVDLFGGDENFTVPRVALVVITITAGTALLMWMGELITQRGVGNGMSLIIFASVVSDLPYGAARIGAESGPGWLVGLGILTLFVLAGIVFVEQGQRRIPVQFAKRVVGRRMYGGQSTYIPLKVNQAGVIPIIFASSVLYLPVIIATALPPDGWGGAVQRWVNDWLTNSSSPLYIALYGLMIVGFTYFYTMITFDPAKQADTIRKQGGFIPGIRPGPQTETYLGRILNRITLFGALFIAAIALLPAILLALADIQNFPFAGTTILISVGVCLETLKQIDSQLMMRNYEGFLKQ
jgi:preprotein translocase subunit SecY